MDKKTPDQGYRLLSSPSNKQFIIYTLSYDHPVVNIIDG